MRPTLPPDVPKEMFIFGFASENGFTPMIFQDHRLERYCAVFTTYAAATTFIQSNIYPKEVIDADRQDGEINAMVYMRTKAIIANATVDSIDYLALDMHPDHEQIVSIQLFTESLN